MKKRRSSFSQLKNALIFPGSRGKTTEDALVRTYKGSTILSRTTSSGYQVGLLLGADQPSAVQASPPVAAIRYLVYFYGNGMCLGTCGYEFAQFRQLGYNVLIPEHAHAMLPWVPRAVVRLFIRERFDNVSKIRQVTCPIFIGHGTADELVPFVMAERLVGAASPRNPVTFLPIEGCGHNGIFEARSGCVWSAIKDFSSNLWQASVPTDESS